MKQTVRGFRVGCCSDKTKANKMHFSICNGAVKYRQLWKIWIVDLQEGGEFGGGGIHWPAANRKCRAWMNWRCRCWAYSIGWKSPPRRPLSSAVDEETDGAFFMPIVGTAPRRTWNMLSAWVRLLRRRQGSSEKCFCRRNRSSYRPSTCYPRNLWRWKLSI